MKKIFIVFILLLFIITGCKKKENSKELDIQFSINNSLGEINDIELDKDDIVSVERIYKPNKCSDNEEDCGGIESYIISPLKEGKVVITFTKSDRERKNFEKVKYTITVDKQLNIKEKHRKIK